jgi:putative FmdB family regulatory protein
VPTYDYRCKACSHELEVVQSFTDDPLTTCEVCGGELRKLFGAPGIAFKGSGFYKNDSRGTSKSTTPAPSEKTGADAAGSGKSSADSSGSSGSSNGSGTKKEPAASTSSSSSDTSS